MKYLITGGAGFIGSHLAEKLVALDGEVTILDNLKTGSMSNLSGIKDKIRIVEGDILDKKLLLNLVKQSDHVIHLAAALGVFTIVDNPLESLRINLLGTQYLLEFASQFDKSVFISSTSEIYGKNDKVPLSENDDRILGHPFKSRWSYSAAKGLDESLAYFYYLKDQLPVRIVRLFNTIGPRQVGSYGMVVPRFVSAAVNNEPLYVFGKGSQIRCFCHVNDATRAMVSLIHSSKAVGEVFNIGNTEQISILNLAKKIITLTGSQSKIIYQPYSQAYSAGFEEIERRVPDISKIKNVLGWKPEIGIDEAILDVLKYKNEKH